MEPISKGSLYSFPKNRFKAQFISSSFIDFTTIVTSVFLLIIEKKQNNYFIIKSTAATHLEQALDMRIWPHNSSLCLSPSSKVSFFINTILLLVFKAHTLSMIQERFRYSIFFSSFICILVRPAQAQARICSIWKRNLLTFDQIQHNHNSPGTSDLISFPTLFT